MNKLILERCEEDLMGSIKVPNNQLWGAQTQRSLKYFKISTEKIPLELITALALIKKVAAKINNKLGLLSKDLAKAIMCAADEVIEKKHMNEFPLVIWQTGSGTQTNMNLNEVLANRASEILGGKRGITRLVHANDDVNKSQSSNDVFPTAMHIAAVLAIRNMLLPQLTALSNTLQKKSYDYKNVVKVGRTHLQDATPLTLGQEISGWVSMLIHNSQHINQSLSSLYELALGGTAVGTGLNTHPDYAELVAKEIAQITHQPFITAKNKFESLATCDGIVYVHGTLKGLAVSLMKIANDIRWLASGPRCGIGEIFIPENEPGSSIMPGKINPTQCEALTMLCCQIMGNDVAINIGGASGNFELNVYRPMIIYNFLQSVRLLTDGIASFNQYCVMGLKPNYKRINNMLNKCLMLVTALTPYLGYDKCAKIAKKAYKEELSLKDATIQLGYLKAEEFDRLIQPQNMILNKK
ncbi:MAG: class II fumarate hydratase [Candidatus Dasytiphilus stammeri]